MFTVNRPPVPVYWVGTSKEDVSTFPTEVKYAVGHALYEAQTGRKHRSAKPLKGFRGAGVLEITDNLKVAQAHAKQGASR